MTRTHYVHETQALKRVVDNPACCIRYTTHALQQMRERDIQAADIELALTNGQVVLSEAKQDELWRVEGRDVDGRRLHIVAAVYVDVVKIKVVTAF